jgi:transcriptional regulator GlxA family with amidase domain
VPFAAHLRIVNIVFATGFGDVSYFNRLFRRHFGDSPSGIRPLRVPTGDQVRSRHVGFWSF